MASKMHDGQRSLTITSPVRKHRGHIRLCSAPDVCMVLSHPPSPGIAKAQGCIPSPGIAKAQGCIPSPGMRYFLNLSAILTLSVDVPKIAFPPYSLEVVGRNARLMYDILLSPSAGEQAEIHISAIKTLSESSYSVLTCQDGSELTRQSKGTRVSGVFELPEGCTNVGLHIWTPFGFSADIGQDPATCLAKFLVLEIESTQGCV